MLGGHWFSIRDGDPRGRALYLRPNRGKMETQSGPGVLVTPGARHPEVTRMRLQGTTLPSCASCDAHLPCQGESTVPHRYWSRVRIDGECWIWSGHLIKGGYAQVRVDGRMWLLHRWIFTLLRGPIPEGHQLHHRCERPACVRPDHLEPLTAHDHVHVTPNSITFQAARQEACKHGHPFTAENTIVSKQGHRKCRTCHQRVNLASFHRRMLRRKAESDV